jgi:microcin C transport system substrate-binding protein
VVGRGQGGQGGFALVTGFSRRDVLTVGAGAIASNVIGWGAAAQHGAAAERHGMSAFGDLSYPADFPHFAYVDPKAPKGGSFVQLAGAGTATFNSLNGFILKGDPAIDMDYVFASLMARASDEPDAVYGLAAGAVSIAPDGGTYRFRLRDGIRFHDGSPITAGDVAFSLSILKAKGHPNIGILLRDMEAAEAAGDRVVEVRFKPTRARDAPLFAATLPIFSRAYYTIHPFDETSLEPPLGSGPYRVGRFEQGRYLEFERVKDWWGAELPAVRGQHNFDVLRYDYYRDRDTAFEGFSAKSYTFREEYTSRIWATRYNFPAIRDGRVKRETIPDERPSGAQGWMINTRRQQFRDPRVREAFALAFDFEWTNKNIMFGSYDRTHSYFQNSDMMAKGKPSPEELALLEPYRGKVPDEAFGEPWTPPVSDGSGQDRRLLRRAAELLTASGWTIKNRRRVNAKGEPLSVEFLFFERSFEPHHAPYLKNLAVLGIDARLRLVEPVQYRARVEDFDFDITVQRMVFALTPGDTLRTHFSSQSVTTKGSYNYSGVADPVVDALVERIIAAPDRTALHAACRALDRVLRAGRYWVPHWYKASHWIAYWDLFGRPAAKPRYARGIPETWWYDRAKASKIERPG